MNIKLINNYNINSTNSPNFKGTVSPEFVKYVNELRDDCLVIFPSKGSDLMKNVCSGIINKSKIVMEKCFHPASVLSIKNLDKCNDALFIQNDIISKHIGPDYEEGFLWPRGYKPPRDRLRQLVDWMYGINNYFFHEAFCQNMFKIDGCVDEYNKETATEIKEVLEWGQNRLSTLSSVFPNYTNHWIEDMELYRKTVIAYLNERIENLNK